MWETVPWEQLRQAALEDRAAASVLLRRLLPRVRNLVRYLARQDQWVDDLSQQALLAVLKGLSSYRGEGKFESWVDKITARETLRNLKKHRAEAAQFSATPEPLEYIASQSGQPENYLRRRELVQKLDTLPEEQRQVLVLHHALGYSIPETAELLEVPFDTAKSRLRLALKKLRQQQTSEKEQDHGAA